MIGVIVILNYIVFIPNILLGEQNYITVKML